MVERSEQIDDAVQAFHNWRVSSNAQVPGTGGPGFETTSPFIPLSKLKEHFNQERQLENILDAVLDSTKRHAVSANYVRENYLKCFAILLCIGEGPMIYQFRQHRSLRDQNLPFRTQPENFPFTEPGRFEAFKKAQWQFCAPRLEYDMDDRFREEDVLPIIHKEQIGEGGSAIIYKIVVDESYNSLRPSDHVIEDRPHSPKNVFVLKTYRGSEAKEKYKAERDAHMKLRWDGKPPPHINAFYGGFIHGKLYNLILEYADKETLEHFMRKNVPPSKIEHALLLWDRLFDVTHGIAHIHGQVGNGSSSSQMLDGWHQDVKPANILVFSGNTASTYDVYFKIADLDLAHFKLRTSLPEKDPSDFDVFGTRAYGAPETYRSRNGTESLPLKVSQEVDLWSLGCIFSEVSVWHHGGWKRVVEYRRRRSKEVERKGGGSGEHIFHFDGGLLDSVRDIHEDMLRRNETTHYATRQILERVVKDMLVYEPRSRPHAPFVLTKSKSLIKEHRDRFGVPETWPVSSNNDEPVGTSESRNPHRVSPRHRHTPSKSNSGKWHSSRAERELPLRHTPPPDDDSEDSSSSSRPHSFHRQHSESKEQSNNGNRSDDTETPKSVGHGALGQRHAQKRHDERPRPTLSLKEGHEWKAKHKKNGKGAILPGGENLAPLNRRNHAFLVDNSETMNDHRREIESVISLLAYMLKNSDEDGLDVYFMHSLSKINSKKSTELSSAIYKAGFQGVSDMRWGLDQIMQDHPHIFDELVVPPRNFFGRQPPPQPPRPLSVYILTDAKWQPTDGDVEGRIKDLVRDMIDKKCRKEQLAIQFIRFGNDPACIKRLEILDHGLGLKAKGMDIIDHTYWDGNVWKQLLGPINDWYDDDPP